MEKIRITKVGCVFAFSFVFIVVGIMLSLNISAAAPTSGTDENGNTEIGDGAFNDFTFLKTIVLADSVRKIGDAAFEDCWRLESCRFSNNISIIAQYAFLGCGLRSIKLPSSVTYIGKNAFGAGRRLKK